MQINSCKIIINRNTAISKEVLRTGFCIDNRLLQDIHQILVIDIVQKIQLFEISGSVFQSFGFSGYSCGTFDDTAVDMSRFFELFRRDA